MTEIGDTETLSGEGPQCPYCGRQYTADDDHYYDSSYTKEECDQCKRQFKVEVQISTSWCCTAIDG